MEIVLPANTIANIPNNHCLQMFSFIHDSLEENLSIAAICCDLAIATCDKKMHK